MEGPQTNIDINVVDDFGKEWKHYNQSEVNESELQDLFQAYFKIFPMNLLDNTSVGADIGCGSGRWAKLMAPRVKKLFCIDASEEALKTAKKNLSGQSNVEFLNASVNSMSIPEESLDFAYSLGVLHHIPDTGAAIKACVSKLKKGAPFLVYLYYAFDNKPMWFRAIWQISNVFRKFISRLPFKLKLFTTRIIALLVYFPLARIANILEQCNVDVSKFPLSGYRKRSFYCMRTDALDRFGTRLEHRFTQSEIISFFEDAGLVNIKVGSDFPYWCAIGYKG